MENTAIVPNDERISTETIPSTEGPVVIEDVEKKDVPKQPQSIPLTFKEMRALKRANYETKIMNNPNYKNVYLLGNTKTGQMVAIRAASSFHACQIIGWKPNRVKLLGTKSIEEIEKEKKEAIQHEASASSTTPTT
jgi:hypothetical protein